MKYYLFYNIIYAQFIVYFYYISLVDANESDVANISRTLRSPQYYPGFNYQGYPVEAGTGSGEGQWGGWSGGGGGRRRRYRDRSRNWNNFGSNPHGNAHQNNNAYPNNNFGNFGNPNNNYYQNGNFGSPNNNVPGNQQPGIQDTLSPGLSGDWGSNRPPGSWGRLRRWWRPQVPQGGPAPPDGFSGYHPNHWGDGGNSDYFKRDRKRRISEVRFEEYMRQIYGNEYDENEILKPEDLNGREIARPGDFPHVAAIGIRLSQDRQKDWKCTGSLISEYFILTAAHCTNFGGQEPTHVKIGDINLYVREDTVATQRSRIEQIFTHPRYNSASYYYDIALIKMKKPAVLTRHVRPARLWVADEIPYNVAFAMGYGATQFGKAPTDVLTYFNLTLIGNEECNKTLPTISETPNGIIDSQICAVDKANHRDTCQGDSGGPLQLHLPGRRRTRFYVIGVTSYGLICGSQQPSVYTRISSFIDWIEQIVWSVENNGYQ